MATLGGAVGRGGGAGNGCIRQTAVAVLNGTVISVVHRVEEGSVSLRRRMYEENFEGRGHAGNNQLKV